MRSWSPDCCDSGWFLPNGCFSSWCWAVILQILGRHWSKDSIKLEKAYLGVSANVHKGNFVCGGKSQSVHSKQGVKPGRITLAWPLNPSVPPSIIGLMVVSSNCPSSLNSAGIQIFNQFWSMAAPLLNTSLAEAAKQAASSCHFRAWTIGFKTGDFNCDKLHVGAMVKRLQKGLFDWAYT